MGRHLGMAARRELVLAIGQRYKTTSVTKKRRTLDEFAAVTGYHRKQATRVSARARPVFFRHRARGHGSTMKRCARQSWFCGRHRIRGKRLRPLIATLLGAMERHAHLRLDPAVRERVLSMRAATIDRMRAGPRAHVRGRSRRRPSLVVRRSVPVRAFADWNDPSPGYVEADLGAHCGESAAGSFMQSLVLTDIVSGWTECLALALDPVWQRCLTSCGRCVIPGWYGTRPVCRRGSP
jgi:hypothetical protein